MKSQGRVRRARVRSKSKRDRKPTPNPTSGDSTSPQGSEGPSREGALVADACEVRGQRPIVLERPELLEIIQIMRKSHSGPLPAPDDFAAYERALPGSCERIMAMAESQLKFSQKVSLRLTDGNFREARWGQLCAFFLALVGMVGCVFTSYHGADWRVSLGLGAGAVGLLIIPFLRRRR